MPACNQFRALGLPAKCRDLQEILSFSRVNLGRDEKISSLRPASNQLNRPVHLVYRQNVVIYKKF